MSTSVITVSTKYQVVIPRPVREALGIKPGQKLRAMAIDDRIEMIPVEPIESLKGFLSGLTNEFDREADRK